MESSNAASFPTGWYWVQRDGSDSGEYVYITQGHVLRVGRFTREPASHLRQGHTVTPAPPPAPGPVPASSAG